jgi:hypothetical protein
MSRQPELSSPRVESSAQRPPIWRLVQQAAHELPAPMSLQDIVDWCAVAYPEVAQPTVRAQVAAVTGNLQSYLNNPAYNQREPILWSVGYSEYEPYDDGRHGSVRRDDGVEQGPVEEDAEEAIALSTRPPVWQLLAQAARELVAPFTAAELVAWFAERHPGVLEATVRTQMSDWAGNSPAYIYKPAYNRRPPILWRVARGQYEPYDSRRHGEVRAAISEVEEGAEDPVEAAQDFILEQYLEEFLHSNWERVDFGRPLELWSPDDRPPRQFDTGEAGRMDFLCRDRETGAIVVVELKRAAPSDSVVGQILRYMGWVKAELARPEQPVEGIIVVGESDQRLRYSVATTPAVRVMSYSIDFTLHDASE